MNRSGAAPTGEGRSLYGEASWTTIIEVTEFSNTSVHMPGTSTHVRGKVLVKGDETHNVLNCTSSVVVYANGHDISSQGYVCLNFNLFPWRSLYCRIHESTIGTMEIKCVVTVLDAEGCRFPQSFACAHDGSQIRTFCFVEKYISRDLLLTDADNLLPDDTLTVQADVILSLYCEGQACRHNSFLDLVPASFKTRKRRSMLHHLLLLDSPLAERLRCDSRYFERMCSTDMAEKNSGHLKISHKKYKIFLQMLRILCHRENNDIELVLTSRDILEVYAMAHFYEIDSVLDTCRCWLRLVHRGGDLPASAISRLVDLYDDKEIDDTKNADAELEVPASDQHEPWTYTRQISTTVDSILFHFARRSRTKEKESGSEHVTEDVSDISHCYI